VRRTPRVMRLDGDRLLSDLLGDVARLPLPRTDDACFLASFNTDPQSSASDDEDDWLKQNGESGTHEFLTGCGILQYTLISIINVRIKSCAYSRNSSKLGRNANTESTQSMGDRSPIVVR
jgi:hypothetical protein